MNFKMKIKIFSTIIILFACVPARAQQKTVHFTTKDGCRIEAYYLAPSSDAYVFINSHGLGSAKYEWGPLQDKLKDAGYGYLSIDLRGHGESKTCGGKPADYKLFTKEDWANISRDIQGAASYLKKKGVPAGKMIFCGASVGANLSLKAALEGPIKPKALILLSPGLEYVGVKTEENFTAPRSFKVLVAASQNDPYAWQSSALLIRKAGAKGLPAAFLDGGGGHGVNMFTTPATIPGILAWVAGL